MRLSAMVMIKRLSWDQSWPPRGEARDSCGKTKNYKRTVRAKGEQPARVTDHESFIPSDPSLRPVTIKINEHDASLSACQTSAPWGEVKQPRNLLCLFLEEAISCIGKKVRLSLSIYTHTTNKTRTEGIWTTISTVLQANISKLFMTAGGHCKKVYAGAELKLHMHKSQNL